MSQTEMTALRLCLESASPSVRMSKLRLLVVSLEKGRAQASKRLVDRTRAALREIIKTPHVDDETLATASRTLIRLDSLDPWKAKARDRHKAKIQSLIQRKSQKEDAPAVPAAPSAEDQMKRLRELRALLPGGTQQ